MGAGPTLSVGLPVYNGERFLEEALRSVLEQSYADFELIVTDNASTDRTADICLEAAARDRRVRYLRNDHNLGAAGNYNRSVAEARGRFFKWVAHDDAYAPAFFERCIEALEGEPGASLCYSSAVFIDEDSREIGREREILDLTPPRADRRLSVWVLDKRDGWCHPVTGVIRTDVLRRTRLIGPFLGADVALVAELLLHGPVLRTGDFLLRRRDHSGRSTAPGRSVEDITAWFDTSAQRERAYMPWWRLGVEFSRSVLRVPMTAIEKTGCAAIMATWFLRNRSRLASELVGWAETGRGNRDTNRTRS